MELTIDELLEIVKVAEENNLTAKGIIEVIRKSSKMKPFVVDYSKKLEQIIIEFGFDCYDAGLSEEHFPTPHELKGVKKDISAKMFYFSDRTGRHEILSKMGSDACRPALPIEQVFFAKSYPELIKTNLYALGTTWRSRINGDLVPQISVNDQKIIFFISALREAYPKGSYFLGIQE